MPETPGEGGHRKKKRPPSYVPGTPEPNLAPVPVGGTPSAAPPATPDHETLTADLTSYAHQQLQDRISPFPNDMIRSAPFTVGSLVFSGLPTDKIAAIGRGMQSAWPWLQQRTAMGEMPGALLAPTAAALRLPDPTQRDRTLQGLNSLQALPPDTQQLVLSLMRNYPDAADPIMAVLGTVAGKLHNLTLTTVARKVEAGTAMEPGQPQPTTPPAATDIAHVELETPERTALASQLAEAILNHAPLTDIRGLVLKLEHQVQHEEQTGIVQKVLGAFDPQFGGTPQHPTYSTVALPTIHGAAQIAGLISAPFEAISWGLREAGQGLEHVTVPSGVVGATTGYEMPLRLGHYVRGAVEAGLFLPSKAAHALGEASNMASRQLAEASGLRPTDPQYNDFVNVTSFLIQWYGFKGLAHAAKGIRTGRAQPAELILSKATKGEVRSAAERAGTPEAPGPTGVKGSLAEVRRFLGGPVIGNISLAIAKMVSLPAERWFTATGSVGKRWLNAVWKTVERTPKDELEGSIAQNFPGLSPEWVRDIASSGTREELMQRLVDRITRQDPATVKAKMVELQQVKERMAQVRSAPGDEYGRLLLDRRRLEAELSRIVPDEIVWRLPKASSLRRIMFGRPLNGFERTMAVLYGPQSLFGFKHLLHFMKPLRFDRPSPETFADTKVRNMEEQLQRMKDRGAPAEDIANLDDAIKARFRVLEERFQRGRRKLRLNVNPQRVRMPSLNRVFDDMKGEGWHDGGPGSPPDWPSRNVEYNTKILERAGVSRATIRRINTRMLRAEPGVEVHDVIMEEIEAALRDSRFISPTQVDGIVNRFHRDYLERQKSKYRVEVPDPMGGTVTQYKDVLKDSETGNPLPSQESQLTSFIPGPNIDALIDATSWFRSSVSRLRENYRDEEGKVVARKLGTAKGAVSRAALLPYDTVKFVFDVSTALLKGPVLVTRLPALIMRIQGEQALRNFMYGYRITPEHFARPALRIARGVAAAAGDIPGAYTRPLVERIGTRIDLRGNTVPLEVADQMGAIAREAMDVPYGIRSVMTEKDTTDFATVKTDRRGRVTNRPSRNITQAVARDFRDAHTSETTRELAKRGQQGFVRWAESPEGAHWRETWERFYEGKAGIGLKAFVDRKWAELQELTNGHPDRLDAVVRGSWGTERLTARPEQMFADSTSVERYRTLQQDVADLGQIIRDEYATGDRATVRAWQEELNTALNELEEMEGQVGGSIPLDDLKGVGQAIEEAWSTEQYRLPGRVRVEELRVDEDRLQAAGKVREAWRRFVYKGLRPLSTADMKGTRGGLFHDIWRKRFSEGVARYGKLKEPEWINRQAYFKAARETSDLLYDLSARSSAHRFTRNLFWFAPAVQEVLTTWLVKIPSQYYWPVGISYVLSRPALLGNLLRQEGIIQKDSRGQDIMVIPGAARFFNKILPATPFEEVGPNHSLIFGYPQGVNVASGGVPLAGGAPSYTIAAAAKEFGGIFKKIGEMALPYGFDPALGPAMLNYFWEAFTGDVPPWEVFSHDAMQQQLDSAKDEALRLAWYRMTEVEGRKLPMKENYPATLKGEARWKRDRYDFTRHLLMEMHDISRGRFLMRALGSSVGLFSLHVSDEYARDIGGIWNKIFADGKMTDAENKQLDDWLGAHPGGFAYQYGKSHWTGKPFNPSPDITDDEQAYYNEAFLQGAKEITDPKDYSTFLQAMFTLQHYQEMKNRDLAGLTAPEVLSNLYEHQKVTTRVAQSELYWKLGNPTAAALAEKYLAAAAKARGEKPTRTVEATLMQITVTGLKSVMDRFSSGGARDSDFKAVVSKMNELIRQEALFFGEPTTPLEKGRSWYFDSVLGPFMESLSPLYDQADAATQSGPSSTATPFFDRIRTLANAADAKTYRFGGQTYPSPSEVLFGLLPPREQRIKTLHWITEPTGWLTDFQRQKAEFAADPKFSKLFSYVAKVDGFRDAYVKDNDVSYSSKEWDRISKQRDDLIHQWIVKQGYGDDGLRVWHLSEAPPFMRLDATGYGAHNKTWGYLMEATKQIIKDAVKQGLSPSSTSQFMEEKRAFLFPIIDSLRDRNSPNYDPGFDRLMTDLAYALAGSGDLYRERGSLYDALLFNSFDTRYVPDNPSLAVGAMLKEGTGSTGPEAAPPGETASGGGTRTYGFSPAQIRNPDTSRLPQGPLPKDSPQLVTVRGITLQKQAMASFLSVEKQLRVRIPIGPEANYRTYELQATIHARGVLSARAGQSMHERGLAVDLPAEFQTPEVAAVMQSNGWNQWNPSGDPAHWSYGFTQ